MPTIRLDREDIERYDPPAVCMKCGAPSDVVVRKGFAWTPTAVGGFWWFGLVGLLITGIIALAQTRRVTVYVPLCRQHEGHFSVRLVVNLLAFAVVLLCVGLVVAVAAWAPDDFEVGSVAVFVPIGACVVWIIVFAVLRSTTIRSTQINEYQITLTGVSHGYIEALRDEWGYEDDYDRPRRRRRRYDEDDDDRPRGRRRRYEDEDEDDRSRRRRRRYEPEEDEEPRPDAKDRNEGIIDPRRPKRPQGDSDAIKRDDD